MKEVSYALGVTVAENFRKSGMDNIDVESFVSAFSAAIGGGKTEISSEEAQSVLNQFFAKLQAKRDDEKKNVEAKFLAENKNKSGVKVTASGLQYEIIVEGNGAKPKESNTVRCHYEGRLLDGTIFDSSYKRNQPADFPVGQVIPGWVEALQLMSVGSKWRLYIPSKLGYGEYGAGELIGPNETLIFDVELLQIL